MERSIDIHLGQESIVKCQFMTEMVVRHCAMSKDTGIAIKPCLVAEFGFYSEDAEESFVINTAINNMVISITKDLLTGIVQSQNVPIVSTRVKRSAVSSHSSLSLSSLF